MNSYNLFEITHSLLRQFGPENWTLYRGKHLLSFVDNHDVTRVASILQNRQPPAPHLRAALRHAGHSVHLLRQRMGRGGQTSSRATTRCAPRSTRPSGTTLTDTDRRDGEGAPREPCAVLRRLQAARPHQQAVHLGARVRTASVCSSRSTSTTSRILRTSTRNAAARSTSSPESRTISAAAASCPPARRSSGSASADFP